MMEDEETKARQEEAKKRFIDVGKIPDFARDLTTFSGERPSDLALWISDVEGILHLYKDLPKTSYQYGLLERTIRRKIVGDASNALNSNNILYNWCEIKNCLILYFRDKRDLQTLDYELTSIQKHNHENLSSYYSRVNELLAATISQIQTNDEFKANVESHIAYFRKKALDSFIRGLDSPLNLLLKTAKVENLSAAYNFCIDYFNMNARSSSFKSTLSDIPVIKPRELEMLPPRPPPRRNIPPIPAPRLMQPRFPSYNNNPFNTPRPQPLSQNPFHNQTSFNQPRQPPQFNPFQNTNPFRPQFHHPRPQQNFPKPEPMDVDQSIRSRHINYSNRPQNNSSQFKRQAHALDDEQCNLQDFCYENEDEYYTTNLQTHEDPYEDHYDYMYPADQKVFTDVTSNHEKAPEETANSSTTANFLEWNPSW